MQGWQRGQTEGLIKRKISLFNLETLPVAKLARLWPAIWLVLWSGANRFIFSACSPLSLCVGCKVDYSLEKDFVITLLGLRQRDQIILQQFQLRPFQTLSTWYKRATSDCRLGQSYAELFHPELEDCNGLNLLVTWLCACMCIYPCLCVVWVKWVLSAVIIGFKRHSIASIQDHGLYLKQFETWHVLWFFFYSLDHFQTANMQGAGFLTYTAASHQGGFGETVRSSIFTYSQWSRCVYHDAHCFVWIC